MEKKYKVGILGCTGLVGQKLIQLLLNNPKFEIEELGASEKSIGKLYKDATQWIFPEIYLPDYIQNKIIKLCIPENFKNCDLIFSTLTHDVASQIEHLFLFADLPLISNSSFYRTSPEVPLIVPYINNDHLQIVQKQRITYNLQKGFIITNANCVVTGIMYAIYNLHKNFNIKQMNIVTMQSISTGYSEILGYNICNNIIPYIDSEEEKLKQEPLKILGYLNEDINIVPSIITIDATCNRVNVTNGHTSCISLKFNNEVSNLDIEDFKKIILENNNCIKIHEDKTRPQPRIDINYMNGFGISIGRIRKGEYWDLEMTIVSNNTVLGSAGSLIMNAEICIEYGLV